MKRTDPIDVICISDSESSESSIVLLKASVSQAKKVPESEECGRAALFQNNEETDVVTLSSFSHKSTERCPVTWPDSAKKTNFLNVDTFYSPSPRTKVSHWLSENASNYPRTSCLEQAEVQLNVTHSTTDSLTSTATNKGSILIRQDYKKTDPLDTSIVNNVNTGNKIVYLDNTTPDMCNNKVKIIENITLHIDSSNVQKSDSVVNSQQTSVSNTEADIDVEVVPISPPLSILTLTKAVSGLCEMQLPAVNNDDETKTQDKHGLNSCSPEIQKKFELCQYLKLMNMTSADTRTSEGVQNRRSTRVKRLALMSEKKELERRLHSRIEEEGKKKGSKSVDTDSKHSSDNDNGSKTSKKSSTSTTASVISRTSSDNMSLTQKVPLGESKVRNIRRYSEIHNALVKTPSKSLQVPEVSTTSISKSRHEFVNSSPSTNMNKDSENVIRTILTSSHSDAFDHPQENNLNNTYRSGIITTKSLKQLSINVENLKPLRNMRTKSTDSIQKLDESVNFSFAKYASNIPNSPCDFDDTITGILKEEIVKIICPIEMGFSKHTELEQSGNKKEETIKVARKRKVENSNKQPKSKVSKLNKSLRLKRKGMPNKKQKGKVVKRTQLKRRKNFGNALHIIRLRSKVRLKKIEARNMLFNDKKIKVPKRKLKKKLKMQQNLILQKNFKTAELIQHGTEDIADTIKELADMPVEHVEIKTKPPETSPNKVSPTKIVKRLPEAEVWKKYFTSEHRKAYIESIKYLEDDSKKTTPAACNKDVGNVVQNNGQNHDEDVEDSAPCYGFKTTEIKTSELRKLNETCDNIKSSITPLPYVVARTNCELNLEKNQVCTEDLEVDQLMTSKRLKDQATQKNYVSPSIELDGSHTDLADHSRCSTSSASASSANSWSLQTVESNIELRAVSSVQDVIEVPYGSATNSEDLSKCTTRLSPNDTSSQLTANKPEVINISQIEPASCTNIHPQSNGIEVKSLNHFLTLPKSKLRDKSRNTSPINQESWETCLGIDNSPRVDRRPSQSHTIYLSNTNGAVMSAYYLDCYIIIVQELMVSFWNQSPLGNILGAQDMWIPKGNTRRMVLGNGCVHKESSETVISFDNTVAYIELWTKEHKSDKRERPVADIFIAIYLRLSLNGPDKKVLQLENIHGYANDVQYIVLKNARSIIVSWNVVADEVSSTLVHCYNLSSDYQMVTSITKMQTVAHYVSSLHNIEDCDTLILGCGDYKITLWDLEHGYIVATIDLTEIHAQPHIVWAKCDRGFLFTLHHFDDGVLQLIAINSFDSTWKKLQSYKPELDYENLLGVCMENGLLVAFYDTGISCWSAQTGMPVIEDTSEESGVLLPYGKHVVVVLNNQVHVRHALEYLIAICPMEDS